MVGYFLTMIVTNVIIIKIACSLLDLLSDGEEDLLLCNNKPTVY